MNMNLTLIGQAISFAIFVWFCLKYVWPPILNALEERETRIADGLARERDRRVEPRADAEQRGVAVDRERGRADEGGEPRRQVALARADVDDASHVRLRLNELGARAEEDGSEGYGGYEAVEADAAEPAVPITALLAAPPPLTIAAPSATSPLGMAPTTARHWALSEKGSSLKVRRGGSLDGSRPSSKAAGTERAATSALSSMPSARARCTRSRRR